MSTQSLDLHLKLFRENAGNALDEVFEAAEMDGDLLEAFLNWGEDEIKRAYLAGRNDVIVALVLLERRPLVSSPQEKGGQ